MKICVANTREFNPMIGGVERVSSLLARQWRAAGADVTFLAQYHGNGPEEYEPEAPQLFLPRPDSALAPENVEYFASIVRDNNIDILLNQAANIPDFTELCVRVREITGVRLVSVLHFSPDVRLSIMKANFFVRIKLGRSVKAWAGALLLWAYYKLYKFRLMRKEEGAAYSRLYEGSDAVVLLSEHFRRTFVGMAGVSDESKLFAISNPLELAARESAGERKKQLLYVGRMEYGQKRVDRLIEIWEEMASAYPDWSLVIVGDGNVRGELEEYVRRKGIERVRFEGFRDPFPYYENSPMICLTSNCEGFGMVLVEAQYRGCVPVAYDSFGSLEDIIDDGDNGVRIAPFDKSAYISALKRLMDDVALRQRMSERAEQTCRKFDVKVVANKWLELFGSMPSRSIT